jgi:hypothetical protein
MTDIPPLRIAMRNYFSTYLLWSAQHSAGQAQAIEHAHTGDSRFDIKHRAYVLTAVISAACFVEAMVNELFQDAHDSHGTTGDGYIAPLSSRTRESMGEWWESSGQGFEKVLEKYQLLLDFAGKPRLDKGKQPLQDAHLLVDLRNTLVHYRPETIAADVVHRLYTRLHPKNFADNALMAGSGNPWWPDHALGAGCAEWAYGAGKALTDRVSDELRITPNYRRPHKWT